MRQSQLPATSTLRPCAKPKVPTVPSLSKPPSFRSYEPEVIQYARYLGMDPVADRPLLWVAQQGLDAPLPAEWSEYSSHDGAAYFHNKTTGDTSWTHPTDSHYWSLYRKLKKQHQCMENKGPAPPATARPSSGRPNTHHTCRLARPAGQQLLPEVKCPRPQTSRLASESESSTKGGYISNILSLVRDGSAKKIPLPRKQTKEVNQTQNSGLTKEAEVLALPYWCILSHCTLTRRMLCCLVGCACLIQLPPPPEEKGSFQRHRGERYSKPRTLQTR